MKKWMSLKFMLVLALFLNAGIAFANDYPPPLS